MSLTEPDESAITPSPAKKRRNAIGRIHKLAGIVAALWLAVIGATGFLLNQKDWRWIWQTTVPESLLPKKTLETAAEMEVAFYRIDPGDPSRRIAAGRRGAWLSDDAGNSWRNALFSGLPPGESPQVFSIVANSGSDWNDLWLATDDGIWMSINRAVSFERLAMPGVFVSSLAQGSTPDELIGVADRSSVFTLDKRSLVVKWVNLSRPSSDQLPDSVSVSRFVSDLHHGRGIVTGIVSTLMSDIAGIALILLPITGVLFWLLSSKWKKNRSNPVNDERHLTAMRRFRMGHGAIMGIVATIPILYLSVTGVMMGHREEILEWMTSNRIAYKWLTPAYGLSDWNMEIYSVAGYPGEAGKFSLGVRSGFYTTADNGATWEREKIPGPSSFFVWTTRRMGGDLFIGAMGGPNLQKLNGGEWKIVKGAGHMPTDVFTGLKSERVWKSHRGFLAESGKKRGEYEKFETGRPTPAGVSVYYLITNIHSGLVFHSQWKWVNDFFAVLAVILCVTGLGAVSRMLGVSVLHPTVHRG
ncbi:MAG: PepSY domain-containing protein [Nitrospinae bacterium]|nr:PepSY domain-containing protein [Nitrospinota bacterium]MBF0633071.1 PepSY domain-containing protein [Nitrospinota bacterium]